MLYSDNFTNFCTLERETSRQEHTNSTNSTIVKSTRAIPITYNLQVNKVQHEWYDQLFLPEADFALWTHCTSSDQNSNNDKDNDNDNFD